MATFQIDYVANWATRLKSLIFEQYKNKPNIEAFVDLVLAPQFQDLEDSAQSMLGLTAIDSGAGAQLDFIGTLVGQSRLGTDDGTYKLRLHARVQANRSNGRPSAIYATMDAFFGGQVELALSPQSPGSLFFYANTPITRAEAQAAASFLADSTIDGVRAYFLWQEQPTSQTFTFDGAGEGFDGGAFANVVIGIPT